jgi:hypothetical protein
METRDFSRTLYLCTYDTARHHSPEDHNPVAHTEANMSSTHQHRIWHEELKWFNISCHYQALSLHCRNMTGIYWTTVACSGHTQKKENQSFILWCIKLNSEVKWYVKQAWIIFWVYVLCLKCSGFAHNKRHFYHIWTDSYNCGRSWSPYTGKPIYP